MIVITSHAAAVIFAAPGSISDVALYVITGVPVKVSVKIAHAVTVQKDVIPVLPVMFIEFPVAVAKSTVDAATISAHTEPIT